MKPVARIQSCYREKFGIPRQSGLVQRATGTIVFEPGLRHPDIVRGLEGFSHLWLIWTFSANAEDGWSPTVRPPRLGGNKRLGVFATRSPFRPNPLGLSAVRLESIETEGNDAPLLHVSGIDLMDGTPILDIKPYVPYADSIPDAAGGFANERPAERLQVRFEPGLAQRISPELLPVIADTLALDPRPSYQEDPQRMYGMAIGPWNVRFRVEGNELTVFELQRIAH